MLRLSHIYRLALPIKEKSGTITKIPDIDVMHVNDIAYNIQ